MLKGLNPIGPSPKCHSGTPGLTEAIFAEVAKVGVAELDKASVAAIQKLSDVKMKDYQSQRVPTQKITVEFQALKKLSRLML